MQSNVFVPTRSEYEEILESVFDRMLSRRVPEIIRAANRQEWRTTSDFEEMFGVSARRQKYYRDECGLPFSQEGRKIFYKTTDVEEFMQQRRVNANQNN